MMRVVAVICLMLSGCGITQYRVSPTCPFPPPKCDNPANWLYQLEVTSGKNAGSVVVHIVRAPDGGVMVDLNEQQINGSDSIKAATAPVSDVAKAVSDTAVTVMKIGGKLP